MQSLEFVFSWTQNINWAYIKRPEDVQDLFWTPYISSIYIQCPGDTLIISSMPLSKIYRLSSKLKLKSFMCFYCSSAIVSAHTPNAFVANLNLLFTGGNVHISPEAVVWSCSVNKMFLEMSQNSVPFLRNTFGELLFLGTLFSPLSHSDNNFTIGISMVSLPT